MDGILLLEQALNGLQYGLMLFLLAAGLTLVFGVMDMINLAHGSLYMVGAFLIATVTQVTGSYWLGLGAAFWVPRSSVPYWNSRCCAASTSGITSRRCWAPLRFC